MNPGIDSEVAGKFLNGIYWIRDWRTEDASVSAYAIPVLLCLRFMSLILVSFWSLNELMRKKVRAYVLCTQFPRFALFTIYELERNFTLLPRVSEMSSSYNEFIR